VHSDNTNLTDSNSKTPRSVASFYDDFSKRFVDDIVQGNERVELQLKFLLQATPAEARDVLVVGCGAGQSPLLLATKAAQSARVVAIDLSKDALNLAQRVFGHRRIEYLEADVISEPLNGKWDVIVFPDSYEHIAVRDRAALHVKLDGLLSDVGRILLTVPSPGKQRMLKESGQGLQIIDEVVSLEDLRELARSVKGTLTYFNMISVWQTNDYVHAVVERGADRPGEITQFNMVPIKGCSKRNLWIRGRDFLRYRLRIGVIEEAWKRRRLMKRLQAQ